MEHALPEAAFIDPTGANAVAVRLLAQQVLDVLLASATTAASHPPQPAAPPDPALFTLPQQALGNEALLGWLEAVIQGAMNPAHPGWIGHMDPLPATASLLGDLVAAALNNNMLSAETSPLFTPLEQSLTQQVATRFGLGPAAGGVLTAGGTLANLQALAVARNLAFDAHRTGLSGLKQLPAILASEHAHTSLHKATMLLGLGTDAVTAVPADDQGRMTGAALEQAIADCTAAGRQPFCVVATAGTTVAGSIDHLPEIAAVARAHDLWLHVDAAYGGAIAFSPTHHQRLAGIEQADSITFNPQKWLYVAKTCAMILFRDERLLRDAFRVGAPYMREGSLPNLGELGVQGTRHADALKLALTIQSLGLDGLAALIDSSYRLTDALVERLERRSFVRLAAPSDCNIVCFRGQPSTLPADRWDAWNAAVQARLLRQEQIFVSLPRFRGANWLRVVLLNPFTDEHVLERLVLLLDRAAAAPEEVMAG